MTNYGQWVSKRSMLYGELDTAQDRLRNLRQTKDFIDNAERLIEEAEQEVSKCQQRVVQHCAAPVTWSDGREFL